MRLVRFWISPAHFFVAASAQFLHPGESVISRLRYAGLLTGSTECAVRIWIACVVSGSAESEAALFEKRSRQLREALPRAGLKYHQKAMEWRECVLEKLWFAHLRGRGREPLIACANADHRMSTSSCAVVTGAVLVMGFCETLATSWASSRSHSSARW